MALFMELMTGRLKKRVDPQISHWEAAEDLTGLTGWLAGLMAFVVPWK